MADVIYIALDAIKAFLDRGSLLEGVAMMVLGPGVAGLAVAFHECGHALVAALTGNSVREMRVGNADDVTIAVGSFQLHLGRALDDQGLGGYVVHDARLATPGQMLAIALGGPAANLFAAAVLTVLAVRTDGPIVLLFVVSALTNATVAVENLRPSVLDKDGGQLSDGRIALLAWEARHGLSGPAAEYADPNAATSVAPPVQDAARATRPA